LAVGARHVEVAGAGLSRAGRSRAVCGALQVVQGARLPAWLRRSRSGRTSHSTGWTSVRSRRSSNARACRYTEGSRRCRRQPGRRAIPRGVERTSRSWIVTRPALCVQEHAGSLAGRHSHWCRRRPFRSPLLLGSSEIATNVHGSLTRSTLRVRTRVRPRSFIEDPFLGGTRAPAPHGAPPRTAAGPDPNP
jgi:hypothetical protein